MMGKDENISMAQTYVIYHDRCLDGMTAAAVAYQRFGAKAIYLPGVYDKLNLDALINADVYMVDFSLKAEPLKKLIEQGNRVTIIDHHEDAIHQIKDIPIHALIFDTQESGASLAWKHFYPDLALPKMVECVRDHDLWRFEQPETRGFIAWLEQFPLDVRDFSEKLVMTEEALQQACSIGSALYAFKSNLIAEIVKQARPCQIQGRPGWAVNGPYVLRSDIGEALNKRYGGYALIWSERSDGEIQVSFRASEGTAPRDLAQAFGGSGHPTAAGCVLSAPAFQRLMAQGTRIINPDAHAGPHKAF